MALTDVINNIVKGYSEAFYGLDASVEIYLPLTLGLRGLELRKTVQVWLEDDKVKDFDAYKVAMDKLVRGSEYNIFIELRGEVDEDVYDFDPTGNCYPDEEEDDEDDLLWESQLFGKNPTVVVPVDFNILTEAQLGVYETLLKTNLDIYTIQLSREDGKEFKVGIQKFKYAEVLGSIPGFKQLLEELDV